MTKILLPVDGSPNALRAARKVVEMASLWKEAPRIVPPRSLRSQGRE